MSFEVMLHYTGYKISIGVGRLFHARTLQEAQIALEHYFKGHPQAVEGCPLCEERTI